MDVNPIKKLYSDYITILKSVVIKYTTNADMYETLEIRRDADTYRMAYLAEDTFYTYYNYNKEVIANTLGIIDTEIIDAIYENRELIPVGSRNNMLIAQRKYIVDNYVERNNYYRMLNGLPNIEENTIDYIYVEEHVALEFGVPDNIPIHELNSVYISTLEIAGYIALLQEQYPTKEYLKYLGNNKIDFISARDAKHFALLKTPYNISELMWNEFTLIYEQCREYFMSCIYIKQFRDTIDHYDNFIAMCIMTMTITQILARILKSTINREFFDDTSVKILFSVYGIPYHENMDSNVRNQIVQSLNMLIQNKGTNQVIYDITSILGYDRITLYKYYLMKSRKFDSSGMPIEATKIDPTTGDEIPDYDAMYNIYFQKVGINDMDTYKSLTIDSNNVSYEDITSDDPYWVDDANLYKELYETEFNFIESKYMGASISYKMTSLLYDNMYLMRMLLDNKETTQTLMLDLPKFPVSRTVSLFDTIVILCALTCKYNSLAGNVLTKPSQIMHVLGFNFDIDYKLIRYDILQDPNLDDELAIFFEDRDLSSTAKINNLFDNYKELYIIISNKLGTAKDIDTYRAYYKLYKTIFYTKENQEIFKIGSTRSGSDIYAQTYMDYLQARDTEVYNIINIMEKSEITSQISGICNAIQSAIPSIQYLGLSAGTSSSLEVMLLDLVRFFKSYTTDMISFDTLYVYDLKPENILRLIDSLIYTKTIYPKDEFKTSFSDNLEFSVARNFDEIFNISDILVSFEGIVSLNETLLFIDEANIRTMFNYDSKLILKDMINDLIKKYNLIDTLKMKDTSIIGILLKWNDKLELKDECRVMFRIMKMTYMSFFDIVHQIQKSTITNNTTILLKDIMSKFSNTEYSSMLTLRDYMIFRFIWSFFDRIGFTDTERLITDTFLVDDFLMKDVLKDYIKETSPSDNFIIYDDIDITIEYDDEKIDKMGLMELLNLIEVHFQKRDKITFNDKLTIIS